MDIRRFSLIVIFASLLIRAITFAFSSNFGADSIIRSLISLNWSHHPFIIWHPNSESSVWLPLQFYINGIVLMIWDNVKLVPRLVSLVASLLTLPLFWGLVARIFDREKAYFATACFALYSIHIKFGNIAGSESLFILFMVASMYGYHRFLDKQTTGEMVLLSVAMLAAVMIRFEAWLLPPFVFVSLLIQSLHASPTGRSRFIFGAVAVSILPALFILSWLYGSFRETGDMLYSLNAASSEHSALTQQTVDSLGNLKTMIYRAAFWPGVIIISLSPLIALGGFWGMIRSIMRRTGMEWIILLAIQSAIYLYQSIITGELSPLARYTILPGTILCIFAAHGSFDLAQRFRPFGHAGLKLKIVLFSALLWTIILCPNYREVDNRMLSKLASVSPVTQYPSFVQPAIDWLKTNLEDDQTVIFNSPFFTSNAVIMYSELTSKQFIAVNESSFEDVKNKIISEKPSYFICHRLAPLRIEQNWGPIETPILLDNMILQYTESAGEFAIYIPQYKQ